MKEILYAGDSIDEEVEIIDPTGTEYTGDDGWAAQYIFQPRGGGAGVKFTIPCSWTGDAYRYQVTTGTSAAWQPDSYTWFLVVTKSGLQVTVEVGTAEVRPNPISSSVYDGRTQAEKAYEDCEAALAQFNASGGRVKSYSIAGRSMEFSATEEITSLVNYWAKRVRQEQRRKALDSGAADPNRIFTRFV